jgi:hypothetical protein
MAQGDCGWVFAPEHLEQVFQVQLLSRRRKAYCPELLPNISALVLTTWGVRLWEYLDVVPRK